MKKWIKRNIKRICAIVMVSMIAISMCLAISADDVAKSHIDDISFGDDSIVTNTSFGILEQLVENDYMLHVVKYDVTDLPGLFHCTLFDFYIDNVDEESIMLGFNDGELPFSVDTIITINYSESLDSVIHSETFNFIGNGAFITIPYTDFGYESFYIHSIDITSSIEDIDFTNFLVLMPSISEFERTESTNTVLDAVLDVFSNVGTWIAESVQNLIPMVYVDGSLTFLGVLAVASLAISVVFVILTLITNFLRFRG